MDLGVATSASSLLAPSCLPAHFFCFFSPALARSARSARPARSAFCPLLLLLLARSCPLRPLCPASAHYVPPPQRSARKMEALAALSVACNVFQVVSFTHETVTLLKTLRAAGTPDPGLANHARRLQELSSQLQTSLQNASTLLHRNGGGGAGGAGGGGESSDSRNTPETSLDALAQRCIEVAAQIQTEMDKITSSRYSATRLARALRARRRLDALDVEMHGCQQTLHTGLLAKLW